MINMLFVFSFYLIYMFPLRLLMSFFVIISNVKISYLCLRILRIRLWKWYFTLTASSTNCFYILLFSTISSDLPWRKQFRIVVCFTLFHVFLKNLTESKRSISPWFQNIQWLFQPFLYDWKTFSNDFCFLETRGVFDKNLKRL